MMTHKNIIVTTFIALVVDIVAIAILVATLAICIHDGYDTAMAFAFAFSVPATVLCTLWLFAVTRMTLEEHR